MKITLLLSLLLTLFSCKPNAERSMLPIVEVLFGTFRTLVNGESLSLVYSPDNLVLTQNLATTITPQVTGGISTCSSVPTLPVGLSIDNTSCVISGTPNSIQAATAYTITASNDKQSISGFITISINAPPIALPTVSFDLAVSSGNEPTLSVTIPITISSSADASVNYAVTGGTATSGVDFMFASGTLTFTTGGVTTQNIIIPLSDDVLDEADETIILTLSSPTNVTLGINPTHTYTILDDDASPTVQFTTANQTVGENVGMITIIAQLSTASGQPVTIPLSVNAGSTANGGGTDFTMSGFTITIPTGSISQTYTIPINDDLLNEVDETIIIDMGIPTNATASGTLTHTATITDNDPYPTVQFSVASQSALESAGTMTVTASLNTASAIDVTVPFSINGISTATGGGTDYSIPASPLTILAGSITATITITVANDTRDETNETIVIDMGVPTNATASGTTSHTATITDDDPPPTIQFTSASQIIGEGIGSITITAQLSSISDFPVTVPFTINATSSATAVTDYTITPSPLSIPAGATTANITVTIIGDILDEADETILFELGIPTNATASGNISHTVTITDDDLPPTVQFTMSNQSFAENAGTMTVTAQLSTASGKAISIPFSINGTSTATSGIDYTITASPLSIAAGATTANITISLINEALYEADETVLIDMGLPTNATASGTTSHTATITNDDTPPNISYTSGITASVGEGAGNYVLSVTLSVISGVAASVTINTNAGSATAGSDFTAQVNQVITFPAGSTTATFNIPINDDTAYEGNEGFNIGISSPVDAFISGGMDQAVTITDNDIGIVSAQTLDCDTDGKIDHYKVMFTSAVNDNTFPGYAFNGLGAATLNWLIAGYLNVALHHGSSLPAGCGTDTSNDDVIYLAFTETAGYDTGAKPDLTTTATPILSGAVGNVVEIFTGTVTEADFAKPIVVSISPANGTTGVIITSDATAVFSEDMDTGTFNSTNFYLTGGASVPGVVSALSATSALFNPTANLANNQAHTVTISGMLDLNGNPLVAFSSTFTTAPLNKVLGTVTSTAALPVGLVISNGISAVAVTSGGTNTAYQTTQDIATGAAYMVTITTQPLGQYCTLIDTGTNLSGTAGTTDITVDVNCVEGYMNAGNSLQKIPIAPIGQHLFQGNVTTFAGSTQGSVEGTGAGAQFNAPTGITFDGQNFYVAESSSHKIRKVTPGAVTGTLAGNGTAGITDGSGSIASLNSPRAIVTDGTYLYVAEYANRIKRIRISNGYVETIAGDNTTINPAGISTDGTGTAARFNQPAGLALDNNILYITERAGNKIRTLNLATKSVGTLTSGGSLNGSEGVTLVGNYLYVVNINSHTIVRVDKMSGIQTVFAGINGTSGSIDAIGTSATFNQPHGIFSDGTNLFVGDYGNSKIRQIEIITQKVTTLAGSGSLSHTNGVGIASSFYYAYSIVSDGRSLFVNTEHIIRKIMNNGLVAYYPLLGNGNDYAGTNNGTPVNAPAPIVSNQLGVANSSYVFNGTNQNITGTDTGLPAGSSSRSICSWVKPNSLPAVHALFVAYGTQNNGQASGLGIYMSGGVSYVNFMAWGTVDNFSVPFKISTTSWTHICGTYNGTRASLYVNGKLIGFAPRTWNTALGTLRIGSQINNGDFFNGSLADIRIYSRALNEGEINELAQNAAPAQVGASYSTVATGLLNHYNFDGGALTNLGPIVNTLTVNGAATSTNNGKDGNPNGAYNFAMNSGQYLNGTTDGIPLSSAPRTLCAWIKPDQTPNNSVILSYGVDSPNNAFGITATNATDIQVWNWTAPGCTFTLSKPFRINEWQHICAMFDGTNVVVTYDGKSLGSQTFGTATTTISGVFRVGANVNSASTFPGKIDDVRVYNNSISVAAARQLATQVPMGLVARYDFNGDAKDASGFGNDGTVSGATATIDKYGYPSSAYNFNGASKISTTIPATTQTDNISLTAWVRPTSFVSGLQYIVANGTGANGYGILVDGVTGILKGIAGGGGGYIVSTVSLPLHVWSHVSLIRTNGTWDLLLNGRIVQTLNGAIPAVPTGGVYIGSDANTGYINGEIDDVRIYNRNLIQSEILALSGYHPMQVSTWNPTPASSSLKFHLQADSLSNLANNAGVPTWSDSSGSGFIGTATGTPTFLTSSIGGKSGVLFSGATQYFNFPGSIQYATSSAFFVLNRTSGAYAGRGVLAGLGSVNLYDYGFSDTNTFGLTKNGIGDVVTSTITFFTSAPLMFSVLHNQPTSNGTFFQSGTSIAPTLTNANQTPGGTSTSFDLGASLCRCTPYFFDGVISEIVYFNEFLTATNKVIVECYLSSKYNLPLGAGTICP